MKIPNLERAVVPPKKITDYLLSDEKSGGKAAYFVRFGFSMAKWDVLAEALYNHAAAYEVAEVIVDAHGTKYVVDGPLNTPDQRRPLVRTVWLIENGTDFARFITAYPVGKGQR